MRLNVTWTTAIVLVLTLLSAAFSSAAEQKKTIGWIEKGKIMPWGITTKLKMDTGALTSSMHAEHVEEFKKDGEDWVRFDIKLEDSDTDNQEQRKFERRVIRDMKLRGAAGAEHRVTVLMKVCVGNEIYEEEFSLNDRDKLNYPVLIGRRTIEHLGAIDVTRTFTIEPTCDADSKLHSRQELIEESVVGQ